MRGLNKLHVLISLLKLDGYYQVVRKHRTPLAAFLRYSLTLEYNSEMSAYTDDSEHSGPLADRTVTLVYS